MNMKQTVYYDFLRHQIEMFLFFYVNLQRYQTMVTPKHIDLPLEQKKS